ncbi:MAG: hypothetical protein AAF629_24920, partial [Chloroflexota bacterium]
RIDVARKRGAARGDGRVKRFLEHVWRKEQLSGREVTALCVGNVLEKDSLKNSAGYVVFASDGVKRLLDVAYIFMLIHS